MPLRFCLPSRGWLERAAESAGFRVEALLGDYTGAPFDPATSPYMIWRLRTSEAR